MEYYIATLGYQGRIQMYMVMGSKERAEEVALVWEDHKEKYGAEIVVRKPTQKEYVMMVEAQKGTRNEINEGVD